MTRPADDADHANIADDRNLRFHGDKELAPGLLDLAVNVRRGPLPPWLAAAVLTASARLDEYPDATAAQHAVAARHGRAADEVLVTAGAAEAFTLLARAIPAIRAAVVHPQFTEPEVALHAAGRPVERVLIRPGETLRPDRVPDTCDLVVVGNPTNPTGVMHPRAALTALCRPGRTVVVDEAFMDAVPGEPETLAGIRLPGLAVVRSLTKTWGLAGLRIGYLVGDSAIVAACRAVQPRWAVSTPGLAAAVACSSPAAVREAAGRAAAVSAERERLRAALLDRGLETVPGSVGTFLLVRDPARPGLHDALRAHGIAVRRGDTFPGLDPGWVRISVRDAAATERLCAALDTLAGGRRGTGGTGVASDGAPAQAGTVTLVGGGPGADDLITVAGLLALARADVVVTDRLAPVGLLAHLPPHVEIIDAAKNPRGSAMPQDKIEALLVEHALAGREVVRLKGGDPFVFGRGYEELEACAAAGVPARYVPGVSSAVAGPAAIGVPVTHRGATHGFAVVSGHLPPDHPKSLIDWPALARSGATIVVLMGVATLDAICRRLQDGGLPADTPAAVVVDAGHDTQREVRATLGTVAAAARQAGVEPPAITVIGAVAALGSIAAPATAVAGHPDRDPGMNSGRGPAA